jgi:hypothetical protein
LVVGAAVDWVVCWLVADVCGCGVDVVAAGGFEEEAAGVVVGESGVEVGVETVLAAPPPLLPPYMTSRKLELTAQYAIRMVVRSCI